MSPVHFYARFARVAGKKTRLSTVYRGLSLGGFRPRGDRGGPRRTPVARRTPVVRGRGAPVAGKPRG